MNHMEMTAPAVEGRARRQWGFHLWRQIQDCVEHAIERQTNFLNNIRDLTTDFISFEEERDRPIREDQPSPDTVSIPEDQLNPWTPPDSSVLTEATSVSPEASAPPAVWVPPAASALPAAWAPPAASGPPAAWVPPAASAPPAAWVPPPAGTHPGAQVPPVERRPRIWVAPLYQMAGFIQVPPAGQQPLPFPAHLQRLDPLPPPRSPLPPPPALIPQRPRALPTLSMNEPQIKSLQQTLASQSPTPFAQPSQNVQTSEQQQPNQQNQQPATVLNPWKIRSGPNCKCPPCVAQRSRRRNNVS